MVFPENPLASTQNQSQSPRSGAFRGVLLFCALIVGVIAVGVIAAGALQAQEFACANCHTQPQDIAASPHAQLGCASCHGDITAYPHPENVPKPECTQCHMDVADRIGQGAHAEILPGVTGCTLCHGDVHTVALTRAVSFQQSIPGICGACHDQPLADYSASIHGDALMRGIPDAPGCATCHRAHDVQRLTPEATADRPAGVPELCEGCHGDARLTRRYNLPTDVVVSFEASYHGLAMRGGATSVANCASCHGNHKILPASNPASSVAPENLAKTCGQCHPGAGREFAIGRMHTVEGRGEPTPVTWVRVAYQIVIPLVIGLMLIHSAGDWLRKTVALRFAGESTMRGAMAISRHHFHRDATHFRMYRMERIQHGLLIASFSVLVWSGFALHYPDHWWAQPLVAWEQGGLLRGVIHRTTGAILIALSLLHVVTLMVRPELRAHWKSLWPRWRDVREAFERVGYFLGIHKEPPALSPHSYVEKVEYWAMVWGTAIMAATGVMLWANTLMLAWAPRVALELATTIHFYEAILATLAVIVWHFYMVIFDPEVYPVDPAWLTGYSVRDRPPVAGLAKPVTEEEKPEGESPSE